MIEKKTYLKECSDECFKGTVVNKTCSLWIDAHLRPFNKRPPKILLLAQVENNEGGKGTDTRKRKQNIRQNTEKKKIVYFLLITFEVKKIHSPSCNLYINLACLFVCLFVSNKRQNGWTDRAQIFCGTSCDPREGLWMIKFSKICLHQNSIFENFENLRIFFWKSAKFFVFIIY